MAMGNKEADIVAKYVSEEAADNSSLKTIFSMFHSIASPHSSSRDSSVTQENEGFLLLAHVCLAGEKAKPRVYGNAQ